MKWFTKGEILTSCFNFDLNRSASKRKNVFKNVCFLALSKNVCPPIKRLSIYPLRGGGGGGLEIN